MAIEEDIKKILQKLEDIEGRVQKLEKPAGEKRKKEKQKRSRPEEGVKKLATKINVSEVAVLKVYDVEEDSLTLVNIIGEVDKEKTKNVMLLVLLGYKYFFGEDNVLSQEIRRNVAENRVPLDGFANHLKEITPSLIRRKGKTRSPKTTYRLTTLGEAEARELLKRMCE